MPNDAKTKSGPAAKAADTRRKRLAEELRSNLHKRKARARNMEKPQEPAPAADKVLE
jgi:hypothetical protein